MIIKQWNIQSGIGQNLFRGGSGMSRTREVIERDLKVAWSFYVNKAKEICYMCADKERKDVHTTMGTYCGTDETCRYGYFSALNRPHAQSKDTSMGNESCPKLKPHYRDYERLKEELDDLDPKKRNARFKREREEQERKKRKERKEKEECEKREEESKSRYAVVLDRLSKEGKALVGQRRKVAQAQLDEENAKAKTTHDAKFQRLQQEYDISLSKWKQKVDNTKSNAEAWKSQGLCPHCGFKTGIFGKCKRCKKKVREQISLPLKPQAPQMPTFVPRKLEPDSQIPNDVVAKIKDGFVCVKLGGIDWRVLDVKNDKALLISEKVLEKRKYNAEEKYITWENCTLRKYLNGEIYDNLGAAKAAVVETRNSNTNNPWYETNGGSATTDKVFLLSLDEVCRYFGDSTGYLNKKHITSNGWLEDSYKNARIAKDSKGETRDWWLRSPGQHGDLATYVSSYGGVVVRGSFVDGGEDALRRARSTDYYDGIVYVRPALWLKL